MDKLELERQRFEAWALEEKCMAWVGRVNGEYPSLQWQEAWEAWQAAINSRPESSEQSGDKLPDNRLMASLLTMIRTKLERRFQASDFVPERIGGDQYALAAEICVEVMTHINQIHTYAERTEKIFESLSDEKFCEVAIDEAINSLIIMSQLPKPNIRATVKAVIAKYECEKYRQLAKPGGVNEYSKK